MLDLASTPPARRGDLVVRSCEETGECVVKDPANSSYYKFGSQEAFLLQQLDGVQPAGVICNSFEQRFGSGISADELQQFVEQARSLGLLQQPGRHVVSPPPAIHPQPAAAPPPKTEQAAAPVKSRQSILYFRIRLFDPDALLSALEPMVRWMFSAAFAALVAVAAVTAGVVLWSNRFELLAQAPLAFRWETALLAWLTIAVATLCHEFAHGLACKRHGGEVRDVGFLLMFLMPCFYCNVSDAWLFPQRSKRLQVTLAGPICDLLLWSIAIFTWRLTLQDSVPNYIACVAMSVLGVRLIFNFNPLMKLDGYYLLSDWMEIPNLRDRSWEFVRAHLRRALWGAPKPAAESRPGFLFCYGMASWWYSFGILCVIVAFLGRVLSQEYGWPGVAGAAVIAWYLMRGLFRGLFGEATSMRTLRLACWTVAFGCLAAWLCITLIEDTATGTLLLRPSHRAEIRARAAGFLAEVFVKEGDRVEAARDVVRLEIPDLASRIAQKHAELDEAEAKQRLVSAGTRSDEEAEQRNRIARAEIRVKLAKAELQQKKAALEAELSELELKIKQVRLEADWEKENHKSITELAAKGAKSKWECDESLKKYHVLMTQWEQAQAQRTARKALGVSAQEADLAHWEHELGEARGQLAVLTAKGRAEEVELEAANARAARVKEEYCYLQGLQKTLRLDCAVAGVVATPRLSQQIGQYYREGDLICEIEDPTALDAEVVVAEQDAARITNGQEVRLTVRGLLLETVQATVINIAPKATPGQVQSSYVVHCRIKNAPGALLPGMTGNARIVCGKKPIGDILVERVTRVLRSEFWW